MSDQPEILGKKGYKKELKRLQVELVACRNGSSTRASRSSSSSRAATPRARAARSAGSPKKRTRG
jgi:hypothetical protein